ncbi:Rrf2 family transcriptional regulator [Sulfuricurvum sp. IAE1]|jgi:Rrf2 family cysteine metabolism transcriptional repressor|uniref:RrF2 family transcriptional regulator n=1 Tax=Sulfuricurvum sp. IAE1 TaxID=2546102 RepID=UPI00104A3721|nr:Rrf2 family transcriptional regulator [Sulfuricurvum sp. IAE1]MDD3770862.1 Rrf2 family transcriptional regulator [Sulfuricurvum sp.]MDX9967261.1 Rrf2 family transcriptional regulator [Sulfuricurvum sp.]TDA64210.1 Rrf2 family transcriptional regulator [Sulfuricurvum sp. IAE1]
MAMLSSKAIYGLAAMHVLSHAPYGRAMQVREIAAMTKISHGYLEQLLSMLRRNHLLNSTRGASGGYKLARPPHEIEVLEIIEALEGPFYKIDGNVGSSLILEYFWGDIEEKMRRLFGMKLSEIDQAYQPYHYDI